LTICHLIKKLEAQSRSQQELCDFRAKKVGAVFELVTQSFIFPVSNGKLKTLAVTDSLRGLGVIEKTAFST
jgi:hypothetical protein